MTEIVKTVMECNMGRAFSEMERQDIRKRLLETGRELFSLYGLKKTSIDDVVARAGISKGAFYTFYPMKELYFWDVLNFFEEEIRERYMEFLEGKRLTRSVIREFLMNMFAVVDEEPLIRRLIEGDEYALLKRAIPHDDLAEHLDSDFDFSRSIIDGFAAAGVGLPSDPDTVGAMIRSLFFISLHREEIGKGYGEGISLLCDIIAGSFEFPGEGSE